MNNMLAMQMPLQDAGLIGDYFIASRLHLNARHGSCAYPEKLRDVLTAEAAVLAARVIQNLPGHAATPLRSLPEIAKSIAVDCLYYKDEALRFAEAGLKSFKVLGAVYALYELLSARVLKETGFSPSPADLLAGKYLRITRQTTVTCATDGNYGRAVAWASTQFGCRAVIFISTAVSQGREDAIARYGAEVRRVPHVYEDAVHAAEQAARANCWDVLSDTAYPGCEELPRLVTQGYTILLEEALKQWPASQPPTHVFVQCGVGGFAAAVTGMLWDRFGVNCPIVVVVEPIRADCAFQSAKNGKMTSAKGDLETVCAGLSCGELSTDAWKILDPGAAAFLVIPDSASIRAMRYLAYRTPSIVAGESSAVGLAGAVMCSLKPRWRKQLRLDATSRVLVFGTEGDTDPVLYQSLINS